MLLPWAMSSAEHRSSQSNTQRQIKIVSVDFFYTQGYKLRRLISKVLIVGVIQELEQTLLFQVFR